MTIIRKTVWLEVKPDMSTWYSWLDFPKAIRIPRMRTTQPTRSQRRDFVEVTVEIDDERFAPFATAPVDSDA
jgi:hypothetical protein